MLRLELPPNLATAAARDSVVVKLELDLNAEPPAALLPGLALLSQWSGGSAKMPARSFVQLTRTQLRALITALRGQPTFAWANQPGTALAWTDGELAGVSEYLREPAKAPAAPAAALTPATAPTKRSEPGQPMTVDGSEHFLSLTLPSREHRTYAAALDLAKSAGFLPEPSNGRWWLRDRHKTLTFLATQGARLRGEFRARFTPNFEKNTAHLRAAEIACAVTEAGGDFDVSVALRAGGADEAALRSALLAGRSYLETPAGVVLLDADRIRRLGEVRRALTGEAGGESWSARPRRVSAARAVDLEPMLEELSPGFEPPATWRSRSGALRDLSRLDPAPLPAALAAQLRPYQRLGAAWLWHLYRHRLGGVLADEMGLGKTLQALALLCAVRGEAPSATATAGPCLVVCPASLLENWRRETARFAPGLRVGVHHGDQRATTAAGFSAYDLLITSYGTLVRDEEIFHAQSFACVVADEAQHIKNRQSQNARTLSGLRAGGRFLLTGTPLENSLDDLRSLFEFLLPGYLDKVPERTRGEDRAWFDQRLRAQTAPYILRRTKAAVAPELPEKLEQIVWCELRPAQAEIYRAQLERGERELSALESGGAGEGALRVAAFTQLLRLRQICCDPRLLPGAAAEPTAEADSAKLEAFRELLAEAVDDGHRLLVFSQFTSLLALLREELAAQEIHHCYLDGAMPVRARQAEVDRFQASAEIPVFLLSLKAGGTGLNLTGADTVVHFDPWWNPAAEAQATDRAHRIGQSRVVTSYKLIASGTVEEKVLGLQAEKRALLADVFEASDAATAKLSLADLKDLLK